MSDDLLVFEILEGLTKDQLGWLERKVRDAAERAHREGDTERTNRLFARANRLRGMASDALPGDGPNNDPAVLDRKVAALPKQTKAQTSAELLAARPAALAARKARADYYERLAKSLG